MYLGKGQGWTHSERMVSSSWEVQGWDGVTKEVISELNLNDHQTHQGYRSIPGRASAVQKHGSQRECGPCKDVLAYFRMVLESGKPQEHPGSIAGLK